MAHLPASPSPVAAAIADLMLIQQRKLIHDIPAAFTNTTPAFITSLESLATDEDQAGDLMIPLKGKLLQAMAQAQSSGNNTNAQQQIAQINAFAEAIRDGMAATATSLRDLDRSAYPQAVKAEAEIYTLWKGIAGYEQLLREDILRQTNALTLTAPNRINPTDEARNAITPQQEEALNLTKLFTGRFEQAVPPEGISRPVPQTSTNQPAGTNAMEHVLSPEDRKTIVTLAGEAVTAQTGARDKIANDLPGSLAQQRHAYSLLKEIEKLLPKDKHQQNNQQQQQPDQQQKQDQQKDQQKQPQPKEQPKGQKQPQKPEPKKGELSPEDLKRLLEKAKQREQEHEQEKRERDAAIPMSPAERDW